MQKNVFIIIIIKGYQSFSLAEFYGEKSQKQVSHAGGIKSQAFIYW